MGNRGNGEWGGRFSIATIADSGLPIPEGGVAAILLSLGRVAAAPASLNSIAASSEQLLANDQLCHRWARFCASWEWRTRQSRGEGRASLGPALAAPHGILHHPISPGDHNAPESPSLVAAAGAAGPASGRRVVRFAHRYRATRR